VHHVSVAMMWLQAPMPAGSDAIEVCPMNLLALSGSLVPAAVARKESEHGQHGGNLGGVNNNPFAAAM
jgi:hypothetical protein